MPLVLDLVADTLLPAGDAAWRDGIAERALQRLRAAGLHDDALLLQGFLRALDSGFGSFALTGQPRRFSDLSRAEREEVLRRLMTHRMAPVRGAAQSLKRLLGAIYYGDVDAERRNPTWPSLNYPGPIGPRPEAVETLVQPLDLSRTTHLECDVVIVGSGAGGGIVAAELAAAGLDTLVLERGPHLAASDVDQLELPTFARAYLDGGLRTTQDRGTLVLAGECLGGGTVVNYTTSFPTPDDVRHEWSRESGLDVFTSDAFSTALDVASERLGVNQRHNRPSSRDALMARGLTAHGWHVDAMPRDVVGCSQDDVCGYCGLGCVRDAKRSSLVTGIAEASRRGARVAVGVDVRRVLVEGGGAVGVVGQVNEHSITVRANRVVVAAGAIGSPALLLRSGLRGAVGHYLRLHPATAAWGVFEQPVRPWTGTLQALYSNQLADQHEGYGIRFETAPLHPGFMALAMPWQSAAEYDHLVRRLEHSSIVGVLARDRSAGRVVVNRRGRTVIRYRVSRYDQAHIRRGLIAGAQVLAAAGAREVISPQHRYVPWLPTREPLSDWVSRMDAVGYGSNQTQYVSFHQMGSCRMGADPRTSVVGGDGQAHAVRNLYVADGSLFPTASGVNPMLTITALAYHVAQHVKSAAGVASGIR